MDIVPTVIERLGLPVPPTCEGRSLLDAEHERLLYHYTDLHGVFLTWGVTYRTGASTYKYICVNDGGAVRQEAYDLTIDPGERNDIAASDDPIIGHMRDKLAAEYSRWTE